MKEVLPISNETLNQYLTVNCYRQTININVSMQIFEFPMHVGHNLGKRRNFEEIVKSGEHETF